MSNGKKKKKQKSPKYMNLGGLDSSNSEFTPIGGKTSKRRRISQGEKSLSPSAKFDKTSARETGADLEGPPSKKIPKFEDAAKVENGHDNGLEVKHTVDHGGLSDHEEDENSRLFSEDVSFENIHLPVDEPPTGRPVGGVLAPRNLLSTLDNGSVSDPVKQREDYMDEVRKNDQLKDAQLRLMAGMVRMQNFTDAGKVDRLSALLTQEGLLQKVLQDSNGEKNGSGTKADTTSHEECIKLQNDLQAKIANKTKRISKLEAESKELQRKLHGEIDKWKQEFKSLEESKKSLEDSLEKRVSEEVASASREQKAQNDTLREQLEASKTEYEQKLHKLLLSSRDKDDTIGKLQDELHSKEQVLAKLQGDLKSLEESGKILEAKNKELASHKATVEREMSELRGTRDVNNLKLEGKVKELQREKQDLENKLADLSTEIEKSERKYNSLQEEQHKREDELERSIRELKREKQANVALIDELTQEVKEKDETIAKKEFLVKRLRESLEMRDNDESDSIKGLRDELKAKLDEISSLKSANEILQNDLTSRSNELKKMNTTRLRLQGELESKDEEILNIQTMADSLRRDMDRKQSNLTEANKKIESLTKQLEKGNLDTAERETQLEGLKSELRDKLERISDLEHEKDELEGRLIDLTLRASERDRGEYEQRQKEINDLKRRIESTNGRCKHLSKELEESNEAYKKSQDVINQLKNSVERKEALLKSAKRENIDVSSELFDLKERYEKLLEERESSTVIREGRDIITENEVIKKLTQKLNKLQAKYTEAAAGYRKQMIESGGLLDRIQKLTVDCQTLKVSNDTRGRELRELRSEYAMKENDSKQVILSLEAEITRLNGLLNKERAPSSRDIRNRDLASYYELQFMREAKRSQDLQVINRYLNSVFKRIDSRLWSDYRKYSRVIADSRRLEEQLSTYPYDIPSSSDSHGNDYYGVPTQTGKSVNFVDYRSSPINANKSRGRPYIQPRRLKFKTVARFVQACVRLRHAARNSHWEAERLRNLRVRLEEDGMIGSWPR